MRSMRAAVSGPKAGVEVLFQPLRTQLHRSGNEYSLRLPELTSDYAEIWYFQQPLSRGHKNLASVGSLRHEEKLSHPISPQWN